MKRFAALLLALLLVCSQAFAAYEWRDGPESVQRHLSPYLDTVNSALSSLGAGVIDMCYEMYPGFVSLGMNGITMPDSLAVSMPIEMYVVLSDAGLYSLTLRMSELDSFANVAAACLYGASPAGIPLETAQSTAQSYANIAIADRNAMRADPTNAVTHSFEEEVVDLQGDQPRAYFAYYPNQYGDGVTWLQMTLIFARPGSEGGSLILNASTPPPADTDVEYEGFFADDNYSHFEVFTTPTPEPDSAAMEDW